MQRQHEHLLVHSAKICCCYCLTQAYGVTKQRSYVVVRVGDQEKQTSVGLGEQR
jgi:hypothetical protein